jgi:predicted Zn-dependent protease
MRRSAAVAALSLLAVVLSACAVNPVSGRAERSLVSLERERELGRDEAKNVEAEMGFVDDARLAAYVTQVGDRIAAESPRKGVDYTFHVVDMGEPNAFALPGGYVYMTRGMLALTCTEDELAGVIGHEVGHVAARHAVQRVSRVAPLGGIGSAANEVLLAPYGRDQEREADRVGAEMSAKAGWDPAALADTLRTLEREDALEGQGKANRSSFFATHPPLPERVETVRSFAATLARGPHRPIASSNAAFLERLDGLVVGKSAAQGIFDGPRFVHPDLDFTITLPKGWKTQSSRDVVGAGEPDGRATIVLDLMGKGDDPMGALAAIDQASGTDFATRAERTTIGGFAGAHATTTMRTDGGSLLVDVTTVAHDGKIFRIVGATRPADAGTYATALRTTAGSFRAPTAEELARIRESRVRVVRGRAGETIAALVSRTGSVWQAPMVVVANGLADSARLTDGQLVKVALSEPYAARH